MKQFIILSVITLNFLLTFSLITFALNLASLPIDGAFVGSIILIIVIIVFQYFIILPIVNRFSRKYIV